MRKHGMFEIIENRALTSDIFLMRMAGDTGACKAPGQFINILLDGVYLRRPISVCDYQEGEITIIYRVVGKGTALLGEMKPGGMLDALTGLGNGYSIPGEIKAPLIIGGGVGIPPLYGLAKALLRKGLKPVAALGFANSGDISKRVRAAWMPANTGNGRRLRRVLRVYNRRGACGWSAI